MLDHRRRILFGIGDLVGIFLTQRLSLGTQRPRLLELGPDLGNALVEATGEHGGRLFPDGNADQREDRQRDPASGCNTERGGLGVMENGFAVGERLRLHYALVLSGTGSGCKNDWLVHGSLSQASTRAAWTAPRADPSSTEIPAMRETIWVAASAATASISPMAPSRAATMRASASARSEKHTPELQPPKR